MRPKRTAMTMGPRMLMRTVTIMRMKKTPL